jgi:hypothetical protein
LLPATLVLPGCEGAPRAHDTQAVQTLGRWEWHGRLVVHPDSHLTIVRMRIDTGGPGFNGDVVLLRYDFNPAPGVGDEYTIALGFELGRARDLRTGTAYMIGPPPGLIPAYATITCLCEPLKLDSARGTVALATRGLRQLTGRVEATLYFEEWNDPSRHSTSLLRQRFDAIK